MIGSATVAVEASKQQVALDLLDNIQASFALYEVIQNGGKVTDLRVLWANQRYLDVVKLTLSEAVGMHFTEIAPHDVSWIPLYGDVALGKIGAQTVESYSEHAKQYIHVQAYSPQPGQVATLLYVRNEFVRTELEKEQDERKIRAMIAQMPEGIFLGRLIYDENSGDATDIQCLYVNQAFEIYEGIRVNTLQGGRLFSSDPNRPKTALYKCHAAIMKNEMINYVRESSSDRVIEVNIYPQAGDQVFIVVRDITAKAKTERQLTEAHETILNGIYYAGKIQESMLPGGDAFDSVFYDYAVLWHPRDIVGGDIYWLKKFEAGAVLCVCDCTGHGTPGALLTMLVVSALEEFVSEESCEDTALTIWNLEQRLVSVLRSNDEDDGREIKDGCDLAVLFIAKNGDVTVSAGRTNVFVCDGKDVRRFRGQRLNVGEGMLAGKDSIRTVHIPAYPGNKFYIASDGLFEQPGGAYSNPYGYKRFEDIVLENHGKSHSVIAEAIWADLEEYRGEEPWVDDLELIAFTL
jgi:serine phosphatase RsbU (regulator of sigma subunit)